MAVESIMYFALGLLVAALLALAIMPAVWRRAVRLTKKRIEAATPISMAEFRADKDQLRAEFALTNRRLEQTVEALRRRLSDQMRENNRKKSELGATKGAHDTQQAVVRELEERDAELRHRVLELEKEGADLAQKLRMRDREYADKVSQLEAAREALKGELPRPFELDGKRLTGNYNRDLEQVIAKLEQERARAGLLEAEKSAPLAHPAATKPDAMAAAEAPVVNKRADQADTAVAQARASMAEAENRVAALLDEGDGDAAAPAAVSTEQLSRETDLERVRTKISEVEADVLATADGGGPDAAELRTRLGEIAADVSRLVYAVDLLGTPANEGAPLHGGQHFAEEDGSTGHFPVPAAIAATNATTPAPEVVGASSPSPKRRR